MKKYLFLFILLFLPFVYGVDRPDLITDDIYVDKNQPNTNNDAGGLYTNTNESSNLIIRSYFLIDATDQLNTQKGETYLNFYVTSNVLQNDPVTINIHYSNLTFDETTATWNNQICGQDTVLTNCNNTASDGILLSTIIGATDQFYSFNITGLFNNELNKDNGIFSLVVIGYHESNGNPNYITFCDKEEGAIGCTDTITEPFISYQNAIIPPPFKYQNQLILDNSSIDNLGNAISIGDLLINHGWGRSGNCGSCTESNYTIHNGKPSITIHENDGNVELRYNQSWGYINNYPYSVSTIWSGDVVSTPENSYFAFYGNATNVGGGHDSINARIGLQWSFQNNNMIWTKGDYVGSADCSGQTAIPSLSDDAVLNITLVRDSVNHMYFHYNGSNYGARDCNISLGNVELDGVAISSQNTISYFEYISAYNGTDNPIYNSPFIPIAYPMPNVSIYSPLNFSTDNDGMVQFNYSVTENSSCTLFSNFSSNIFDTYSNAPSTIETFTTQSLLNGSYQYRINCIGDYSLLNGSSNTIGYTYFTVANISECIGCEIISNVTPTFTNDTIQDNVNLASCPLGTTQGILLYSFFFAICFIFIGLGFMRGFGLIGIFGSILLLILSFYFMNCNIFFGLVIMCSSLMMGIFFSNRAFNGS